MKIWLCIHLSIFRGVNVPRCSKVENWCVFVPHIQSCTEKPTESCPTLTISGNPPMPGSKKEGPGLPGRGDLSWVNIDEIRT